MLEATKTRLRAALPASVFFPLRDAWHRLARTPHVRIARRFAARHGLEVAAGPFAGMRYVDVGSGSGLVPKLIGSYELELHPAIERLVAHGYETVVNIGCGEGYYAVGLARRLPNATCVASDSAPSARALCVRVAAENGVADRVQVVGACTPADVARLAGTGTLFVVDCEGCEVDLLDPAVAPGLADADVLVELHDFARPHAARILCARFEPTHLIELVDTRPRDPSQHAALAVLDPADRGPAIDEGRPGPMQWAVCRSRSSWT